MPLGQKVRIFVFIWTVSIYSPFWKNTSIFFVSLRPRAGAVFVPIIPQGIQIAQVWLKGAFHYPNSSDWFSKPVGASEAFASILREAPHFPLHLNLKVYSPALDRHPATTQNLRTKSEQHTESQEVERNSILLTSFESHCLRPALLPDFTVT